MENRFIECKQCKINLKRKNDDYVAIMRLDIHKIKYKNFDLNSLLI